MVKKLSIFLLLILFLNLLTINSFAQTNESIIDEFNILNSDDIPDEVLAALEQYIEQRIELEKQLAQEELKKTKRIEFLIYLSITIVSLYVLAHVAYIVIKDWRSIKRKARRRIIYWKIEQLLNKGFSLLQIRDMLISQGLDKKYAYDAVHRYPRYLESVQIQREIRAENIKYFFSFTRKARRRLRRKLLIKKIKKHLKKGHNFEQIQFILINKGYKDHYVYDAVHRYKKYQAAKSDIIESITPDLDFDFLAKVRRRARRKILFKKIKQFLKKGLTYENIHIELIRQGWEDKYVFDAVHRYRKKQEQKEYSPSIIDSLFEIKCLRSIRRTVRRKFLIKKINILSKKNLNFDQIKKELSNQGYQDRHINDAIYRYKKQNR